MHCPLCKNRSVSNLGFTAGLAGFEDFSVGCHRMRLHWGLSAPELLCHDMNLHELPYDNIILCWFRFSHLRHPITQTSHWHWPPCCYVGGSEPRLKRVKYTTIPVGPAYHTKARANAFNRGCSPIWTFSLIPSILDAQFACSIGDCFCCLVHLESVNCICISECTTRWGSTLFLLDSLLLYSSS
jgi:hypothetical protein